MIGISKFWGHIIAPSSQQSARIALKTSPIESYQFSASKLCTNLFSNSNQKIFFFGIKNIFRKKNQQKLFFGENPEKNWNFDFRTTFFEFQIFFGIFTETYFWPIFFRKIFLIPKKNIFWLELEKKLVHNFYVENWELSIYEVFRAILALRRDVGANIWHQNFKNRISFAPVPLADFMNFEDFISKKWKSCKVHVYVFWKTCLSLRINRW